MATGITSGLVRSLAEVRKSDGDVLQIVRCSHSGRRCPRVGIDSSQFACALDAFQVVLHNGFLQLAEDVFVIINLSTVTGHREISCVID